MSQKKQKVMCVHNAGLCCTQKAEINLLMPSELPSHSAGKTCVWLMSCEREVLHNLV